MAPCPPTYEGVDRAGFARPVGPQQAQAGAFSDSKPHVPDGVPGFAKEPGSEGLAETKELDRQEGRARAALDEALAATDDLSPLCAGERRFW